MQLLEQILGTKNNIKVLRTLIKHKNWEFNITELARDLDINKGILSRLVENLEKENIIFVKRKGKIKLFGINQKNEFIKSVIIPLFEREENFFDLVLKDFKIKHKNVISIILYGSVATGKVKLTSDVDILIIVSRESKKLEDKLNKLKEDFLDKDILLRVDVIKLSEWKRLYKINESFVRNVLKKNKLLYGKELSTL